MPVGILINSLSIFIGGIIGAIIANKIPNRICKAMPFIFGFVSIVMGIINIIKIDILIAVILSFILGSTVGELFNLEHKLTRLIVSLSSLTMKFLKVLNPGGELMVKNRIANDEESRDKLIIVFILFTMSGTGIFGALTEGFCRDYSILIIKSILDFFTAITFASTLGFIVALIFIPQLIIFISLFISSGIIMAYLTSSMISNFFAIGGIIMLATGFRMCGMKGFSVVNMLPALIIVIPFTYLFC